MSVRSFAVPRALRLAVCFASVWVAATLAHSATAAAPLQEQELISLQAYGDKHAACSSWTDGCVICKRGADAKPNCSTPGIACLPGDIVCKEEPKR